MVYRFADGDAEGPPGPAADLVRLNPDVIVIAGQQEIRAPGWIPRFSA